MLESLHPIELDLIVRLQTVKGLVLPMKVISTLGPSMVLLGLVGFVYLCRDARLGARLLAMYFGSEVVAYFCKLAFHLPRPFWIDAQIEGFEPTANSYGFPSGHSLVAMCVWGLFACSVQSCRVWGLAMLVVVLVSISRVYLGVHFISDVTGGCLIGTVVLVAFVRWGGFVEKTFASFSLSRQVWVAGLIGAGIVGIGLILRATLPEDPASWAAYSPKARGLRSLGIYAGAFFGVSVGLAMMRRWARFEPRGPFRNILLRLVIAAVGGLIYWMRPRDWFASLPEFMALELAFGATAAGLWTFVFGLPWLFLKFGLAEPASSPPSFLGKSPETHHS